MSERLSVLFGERLVGHLHRLPGNEIGLTYADEWRDAFHRGRAFPISLSMPIGSAGEMMNATTYIAGLLPDSPVHREALINELGLADDPSDFALISMMGADNAGALSILPDNQLKEPRGEPGVDWLTPADLADHIRALPRRPLLVDEEHGVMLSLAGVNDKAAVVVSKGRIGLPRNGYPSTHIIKIDIPGLEDSIRTEHFCLALARAAGMSAPKASICEVEDQSFMLMSRYDRATGDDGSTVRLHQEDFCQALGHPPSRKYERHGGPGWREAFSLMSRCANPTAARAELLRRAMFQLLIGNPDAHAKNYSLVFRGPSGSLTPAPLYDLNNAAAFRHKFKKTRPLMAMSIGGQDNRDEVSEEDLGRFARECGFSADTVISALREVGEKVLAALPGALESASDCEAVRAAGEDVRERCESWGLRLSVDHLALT